MIDPTLSYLQNSLLKTVIDDENLEAVAFGLLRLRVSCAIFTGVFRIDFFHNL